MRNHQCSCGFGEPYRNSPSSFPRAFSIGILRFPQVFSGFFRFCSYSGTFSFKKPNKNAVFILQSLRRKPIFATSSKTPCTNILLNFVKFRRIFVQGVLLDVAKMGVRRRDWKMKTAFLLGFLKEKVPEYEQNRKKPEKTCGNRRIPIEKARGKDEGELRYGSPKPHEH